jgi:hypothetical protein
MAFVPQTGANEVSGTRNVSYWKLIRDRRMISKENLLKFIILKP